MADDETTEETAALPTDEPAVEEPVAAESVAADEAPAEDAPPQEPAGEEPGTPTAESDAETPPEEEPTPAPSAEAAPVEIVHPKERRRRARQRSATGPLAPRTPEERKAERDALRAKNATARTLRRHKVREKKPAPAKAAAVEAPVREPGTQKTRQGVVVSDKAAKTITVRVDTSRRHRRYQKIVRSSKTLHAHDENNEAHEGDLVRVIETRPLSATKRWRLAEIVERAR
jgi:small subunit ribosomal protein S17